MNSTMSGGLQIGNRGARPFTAAVYPPADLALAPGLLLGILLLNLRGLLLIGSPATG